MANGKATAVYEVISADQAMLEITLKKDGKETGLLFTIFLQSTFEQDAYNKAAKTTKEYNCVLVDCKIRKYFKLYFTNFNYPGDALFKSLDAAIEEAKRKGFEVEIYEGDTLVGWWSIFRGFTKYEE